MIWIFPENADQTLGFLPQAGALDIFDIFNSLLGIENFIHYHSTSLSSIHSDRGVFFPSINDCFTVGFVLRYRVSIRAL